MEKDTWLILGSYLGCFVFAVHITAAARDNYVAEQCEKYGRVQIVGKHFNCKAQVLRMNGGE